MKTIYHRSMIGYPTGSIYSATKFALDGFSESLAYELAATGKEVQEILKNDTDHTHKLLTSVVKKAMESIVICRYLRYNGMDAGKYNFHKESLNNMSSNLLIPVSDHIHIE